MSKPIRPQNQNKDNVKFGEFQERCKSALTGRGRAPEAGLTRQVPAEARSNYGKNLMTKGYS